MKKDSIVLVPYYNKDIYNQIVYTFGKSKIIYDNEDVSELARIINKRYKKVYIVDLLFLSKSLLQLIKKDIVVKSILTFNLASLTFPGLLYSFQEIMECYDRNLITEIGCLDKGMAKLLSKRGYNSRHVLLDNCETLSNKKGKYIGVVSKDLNPNHNFYNALSAVKLSGHKNVKTEINMFETKRFGEKFGLVIKNTQSFRKIMSDVLINIYPCFTNSLDILGIISLDSGIPFIYGNTVLFDKCKPLKKYLVMKSEDDISELADKINNALKYETEIMKLYHEFRLKYSTLVAESNNGF